MKFKMPHAEGQLFSSPRKLQDIALFMDEFSKMYLGKEILVTRVWDALTSGKESGVHPAKRAFDVRVEYTDRDGEDAFYYSEEEQQQIMDAVTAQFPRHDRFARILCHSSNDGPLHFHVQIGASEV